MLSLSTAPTCRPCLPSTATGLLSTPVHNMFDGMRQQ
jgi:hypothetical protein